MRATYEVRNPSFSDMNIEQQIEAGINDWCAEDDAGHEFFGRSRDEAEEVRCLYMSHRGPDAKATVTIDPEAETRAVDAVFRRIGAGGIHTRAVRQIAEEHGVNERALRAAYDAAINIASEAD